MMTPLHRVKKQRQQGYPPRAVYMCGDRWGPRDADTGLHAERQGSGQASRARWGGDTLDTTHEDVYRTIGRELDGSPLDPSRGCVTR